MTDKKPARRILRHMQILELSAVDNPAQEGATMTIMKRDTKASMFECPNCGRDYSAPGECPDCGAQLEPMGQPAKRDFSTQQREHAAQSGAAMPDGSFPIENGQDLHNAITAWGRAKPGDRGAVARHIRRRAEALGLTDSLPTEGELASAMGRGKSANADWYEDFKGEDTMTEAEKLAKAEKDLADVTAEKDLLAKVAGLSDAEKAHYQALAELDAEGAGKFLDMDGAARTVEIEKAKGADPVIYTDSEGHEYHKSEAKAASLAKRADDLAKKNRELEAAQEAVAYEKRAAEYPHLKGETVAKVALLRAVDGIADEATRTAVVELLKANDAGLSEAMKTIGTKSGRTVSGPEAELERMAKAYAEANSVTYAKAYDTVAQTPEGKKLYAEMIAPPKVA